MGDPAPCGGEARTPGRAHTVDFPTHDLYTTGLLVGRAYALAHASPHGAVAELRDLAAGDEAALVAAEARMRAFADRPTGGFHEQRAAQLLTAALLTMSEAVGHPVAAQDCCPAV
jgi:hypothetical protein